MGVDVGSAHAKLTVDTSDVDKAGQRVKGALQSLQSFGSAAFLGLGAAAGIGFGAIVKSSVSMNATLETTTLQFKTLMGSAEEASKHVAGLFEFAKRTPFETGPIIEASRMMRTFGGAALDTQENLLLIGDAAAATGAPINELGFWVGRMYANLQAGKPVGEAAARLTELGVLAPEVRNRIEELSKSGASAGETFGVLQDGLRRFSGAMEDQASTWEGLTSTIKDSLQITLAEGMKPLFESLKTIAAQVVAALDSDAVQNGLKRFAEGFARLLEQVVPFVLEHGPLLLKILGGLAAGFAALTVVTKVSALIGGLTTAASGVVAAFTGASTAIGGVVAVLGGPVTVVVAAVVGALALLATAWKNDWGGIQEKTRTAVTFIRNVIQSGLNFIRGLWERHGEGVMRVVRAVWDAIVGRVRLELANLRDLLGIFKAAWAGDWEKVGELTRAIWERTSKAMVDTLNNLDQAIVRALNALAQKIAEWWRGIDWEALGAEARKVIERGLNGDIKFDLFSVGRAGNEAGLRFRAQFLEGWKSGNAQAEAKAADRVLLGYIDANGRVRQAAESADRVLLQNAQNYRFLAASAAGAGDAISRTVVAFVLANDNMKLAADRSNHFAEGLGGLTNMAGGALAALERLNERAAAYAAAFAQVVKDFATPLKGSDDPLVSPEHIVTTRNVISGPTEEQNALFERYSKLVEETEAKIQKLRDSSLVYGADQEKINEEIAKAQEALGYYQSQLALLPPTVETVSSQQQGLSVNVAGVKQAIYDQLVAMNASPEVITAYATSVGIMSDSQAEAALKAAAVKLKIEELAKKIAEGMPVEAAMTNLNAFVKLVEEGVNPAIGSVPDHIVDMKERIEGETDSMRDAATAVGEAVIDGLTGAVEDGMPDAEDAAAGVGEGMITATRRAIRAESPAQAFVDIGKDIIQGLINGLNSIKESLFTAAQSIANRIISIFSITLQIKSPSQVFHEFGQNIVRGLIEGIKDTEQELYDVLLRVADKLSSIGSGIGRRFGDSLEGRIDTADTGVQQAVRQLGPFLSGPGALKNLLAMNPQQLTEALRALRTDPVFGANPEAARRMEEAIRQADARNQLEKEYIEQQKILLALEEQRSRLDLLKQQFELIKLIKDNNLSTDLLKGLKLGLDADMGDVLKAMTEAMRQLVDRAEKELEIHSPSAVFKRIGQNIDRGLALGLGEGSGLAAVRQTLGQIVATAGGGVNAPAQTVYIYGGLNVSGGVGEGRDTLSDLYYRRN